VKSLEPSQTARFVRAKVHAVENVIDTTRSDGVRIRVSEALIGDETASVILTARGGMLKAFPIKDALSVIVELHRVLIT
jgi:hypothetical protein